MALFGKSRKIGQKIRSVFRKVKFSQNSWSGGGGVHGQGVKLQVLGYKMAPSSVHNFSTHFRKSHLKISSRTPSSAHKNANISANSERFD